ncbi:MAG: 3-hydroxyacyl-CoA dehydrogenase family protein [Bacteroidales bacterium]|nr:3-hydroxyacyl-CoA dehydrogenase family protein [Bacteroidales bacterium]
MNYVDRMQKVAVLGAAGKMGSGILLLNAIEVADLSLLPENKGKTFVVYAIDVSEEALSGLIQYVRTQVLKAAEKKINWLREIYKERADLIENGQIIEEYINHVMSIIRPSILIESAYHANCIFEAIKEDPDLKVSIFKRINQNNSNQPWFFTNTSSIPIQFLNEKAELNGRIIGYHFYNPPAVQKLVELIEAKNTLPELKAFSLELAKKLNKIIVESNDVVGFIGNGHFMRDIIHAASEVERLKSQYGFVEAIYMINKVSQEYLVRPMGIFQLIDYVGIDVCSYIMSVMNQYLPQDQIVCPLLNEMLSLGIKGGQYADGSQKDGFLKYEKGKIIAIFDINTKQYVSIEQIQNKADAILGEKPTNIIAWKAVVGMKDKDVVLQNYFNELQKMNTLGAELAKAYGSRSKAIGKYLVSSGVAKTEEDVNKVLMTGFFHAYGPINNYFV